MELHKEEYEKLNKAETTKLNNRNYFGALKSYIESLRMLYIHHFSYFDNLTLSEDKKKTSSEMRQLHTQMPVGENTNTSSKLIGIFSNNLLGIISIIISLLIGLVLLILICQFRQIQNYLNQRNASNRLMTPIKPVEVVEKRRENEVNEKELCANNSRRWTSTNPTKCESNVQGIELNLDSLSYCRWIDSFMELHKNEYEKLDKTGVKIRLGDLVTSPPGMIKRTYVGTSIYPDIRPIFLIN
uniref:Uncharacterized protein n=1 Tax=Meloidogyne incognita TaxID=6306 RepID=A0A914LE15_MELIC